METWDVHPGEGIGPLRLGMTRAEVRAAMGEDGERWRSDDELMFPAAAVRADFDADDRVEFIEADHEAPLRLGDLDLFALDRDVLATKVAEALGVPGEWREQGGTCGSSRPAWCAGATASRPRPSASSRRSACSGPATTTARPSA